MKSCIPNSGSPLSLLIVRPPCPELNIPPWMIIFEELKFAIIPLVSCSKWGATGERKTDGRSIPFFICKYSYAQQCPKSGKNKISFSVWHFTKCSTVLLWQACEEVRHVQYWASDHLDQPLLNRTYLKWAEVRGPRCRWSEWQTNLLLLSQILLHKPMKNEVWNIFVS